MTHRHRGLVLLMAAVLLAPQPAAAQVLGRLFFTPEQREALDKERFAPPKKEPQPVVAAEKPEQVEEPPPPLRSFRMEGLVVRSEGPNTAWVDGNQVLRKGRTFQGVTVDPGAASGSGVTVVVPGTDAAVSLKPGQTFDPEAARVSELVPKAPRRTAAPGGASGRGDGQPEPETAAPAGAR